MAQCCTHWGLHWDAGRAGVQLVGFLSPQNWQNPMKVLSQVRGNFSTGSNLHRETSRLSLSLPGPTQMDSLLFPAARGRSCYSKVLLGVIRIKRGLALQRAQPCAATDGPGAFLAWEAQCWSNSIPSNYKYSSFCLFLLWPNPPRVARGRGHQQSIQGGVQGWDECLGSTGKLGSTRTGKDTPGTPQVGLGCTGCWAGYLLGR